VLSIERKRKNLFRLTRFSGVTKHCTTRTALKYGCGKEYTPGNDHEGIN